jgi:rhodanese-related sulfurtransferase
MTAPISAADAVARAERGARVIDVRSLAGRESSGTVTGAEIVAKDAVAEFAATLAPDDEVVVFCGTSAGSGPVVDWLTDNGFSNVSHVDGGFEALKASGADVATPTVKNTGTAN